MNEGHALNFSLSAKRNQVLELEDILSSELLIEAANAYRGRYYPASPPLAGVRLPARGRMTALEKAFKTVTRNELPKVELAYEVIDLLEANPSRSVLEPRRLAAFKSLGKAVLERFRTWAAERPVLGGV